MSTIFIEATDVSAVKNVYHDFEGVEVHAIVGAAGQQGVKSTATYEPKMISEAEKALLISGDAEDK